LFAARPNVGYDFATNTGTPFNYFTLGCSFSLVEVDLLTGDHVVLRSDVVMDLGRSLNPSIDIGQIEGAFLQGLGWCTMEQPLHSAGGILLTRGPGNYKIPSFGDVPREFNVRLLRDAGNERAIHSSKAVGEPPFFTAASVFFAIRDALQSANGKQACVFFFFLVVLFQFQSAAYIHPFIDFISLMQRDQAQLPGNIRGDSSRRLR
jgi:xanthine dehydrogenase/oxidase